MKSVRTGFGGLALLSLLVLVHMPDAAGEASGAWRSLIGDDNEESRFPGWVQVSQGTGAGS